MFHTSSYVNGIPRQLVAWEICFAADMSFDILQTSVCYTADVTFGTTYKSSKEVTQAKASSSIASSVSWLLERYRYSRLVILQKSVFDILVIKFPCRYLKTRNNVSDMTNQDKIHVARNSFLQNKKKKNRVKEITKQTFARTVDSKGWTAISWFKDW